MYLRAYLINAPEQRNGGIFMPYCPNGKTEHSNSNSLTESNRSDHFTNLTESGILDLQTRFDSYISSKGRYEEFHSSGSSLLLVGLVLTILLLVDLSRIIKLPIPSNSRILTDSVIGIISFACLLGSHSSFKKANLLKARIEVEQRQRQKMINWCVSTYSAQQIDKMIEAAETVLPASMEILSLKRMDMI